MATVELRNRTGQGGTADIYCHLCFKKRSQNRDFWTSFIIYQEYREDLCNLPFSTAVCRCLNMYRCTEKVIPSPSVQEVDKTQMTSSEVQHLSNQPYYCDFIILFFSFFAVDGWPRI